MHQHLYSGLRIVESLLDRETRFVESSRPEIAGEGQQMRITEQWNERLQISGYKLS